MKRINLCIFIAFCGLFLNGCSNMVEIEDRDFIVTLFASYDGVEYKIGFGLPDLAEETGQSTGEKDKNIIEFTGATLYEIEEKYNLQSDKKLDYSHLKTIIIDENLGKNNIAFTGFLMYIKENSEISRNTLAFAVSENIDNIVKLNSKVRDGVGSYLENLYKNTEGKGKSAEVTIGNIITAFYNKNQVVTVPAIKSKEDMLMLDGAVLYNGKEISEHISEEELVYISIIKGKGKGAKLFVNNNNVLKIKELKSRIEFSINNKRLYSVMQIDIDTDNLEGSKVSKADVDRYITRRINNIIQKFYMDKKVDCLNLYRKTALKSSYIWQRYQDNHEGFMKDLSIGVSANVKVYE